MSKKAKLPIRWIELFSVRGLFFMGAISLMLAVACICLWAASRHYTAANHWPRTNAHVVEVGVKVTLNGQVKQHEFDATYIVNGRTYTQRFNFSNVPHETEVIAYNPKDPIDADAMNWLEGQPVWDFFAIVGILGVAIWLGFQLLEHLRQIKHNL